MQHLSSNLIKCLLHFHNNHPDNLNVLIISIPITDLTVSKSHYHHLRHNYRGHARTLLLTFIPLHKHIKYLLILFLESKLEEI